MYDDGWVRNLIIAVLLMIFINQLSVSGDGANQRLKKCEVHIQ